jgi:hypothetical protein
MPLKKLTLVAMTAVLALSAGGIGSASATTLRTDPGNVSFPTGNVTIKNTASGTALLTTSVGNFACTTAHLQATINNNHAATLTGTLSQLTLTSCTDTIPLLTFSSCHLHGAAPTVAITANGTGGSFNLTDVGLRCSFTSPGGACYFTAATANGTANNAASSISYTGVAWNGIPGTADSLGGLCFSSATFSVVLNHIVEAGTNRTVTVTS